VTAIFLQGCSADQNPYPRGSLELARRHGRTAATAVSAALSGDRRRIRGPLRSTYTDQPIEFEDPPDLETLERIASSGDRGRERVRAEYLLDTLEEHGEIPTTYPYPMQALGFGDDLVFLALGGEVFSEYGRRLKASVDGPTWVSGYSNAAFTYVPTAEAIYEGGYEADDVIDITTYPGPWKPDLEERILRRARVQAGQVSGPR